MGEFRDTDKEYREIPEEEIETAYQHYPLRGNLMDLANEVLNDAKERRLWKPKAPTYHAAGWEMVLHDGDEKTAVGLWSGWLKTGFYLGYPHGIEVSNELIMDTLPVTLARPVRNVAGVAVDSPMYEGEFKDPDKPISMNAPGQYIAHRDLGERLWAPFWGKREKEGGRVYVDRTDFVSNGYHLPLLGNSSFQKRYFGHGESMSIMTYPFSFHNAYSPDAPTAKPESIQAYKDPFLDLFVSIAFLAMKPAYLAVTYGNCMLPEDLTREKYQVTWLKGRPHVRSGWGSELVMGKKGNETVLLESANSLVPWNTFRQIEIPPEQQHPAEIRDLVRACLTF